MCCNPITIRNPRISSDSSFYLRDKDKYWLQVPCGHCPDCVRHKKYEWQVRNYYEYLSCVEKGGYALMETLTFNEENVPTVYGLKCFSKREVQLFLKRLHKRLTDMGYPYDVFRYFLVSEYGGKTYRPHHHVIFYVYDSNLDIVTFCDVVRDCWSNGFTDNAFPQSKEIHDISAIKYVSKYISKDIDFDDVINYQKNGEKFREEFFVRYQDRNKVPYPRDFISARDLHSAFDAFMINDMYPFHLQSKHFGESILGRFTIDELLSGSIPMPDKKLSEVFVPLPSYISRKLFYNYNKSTKLYTLNDLGKEYKTRLFNKSITDEPNKLKVYFDNLNMDFYKSHFTDIDSYYHNMTYSHSDLDFTDFDGFSTHLKTCVECTDYAKFASFVMFYRGRSIDTAEYVSDDSDFLTLAYSETLNRCLPTNEDIRFNDGKTIPTLYEHTFGFQDCERLFKLLACLMYVDNLYRSKAVDLQNEQHSINKLIISSYYK